MNFQKTPVNLVRKSCLPWNPWVKFNRCIPTIFKLWWVLPKDLFYADKLELLRYIKEIPSFNYECRSWRMVHCLMKRQKACCSYCQLLYMENFLTFKSVFYTDIIVIKDASWSKCNVYLKCRCWPRCNFHWTFHSFPSFRLMSQEPMSLFSIVGMPD